MEQKKRVLWIDFTKVIVMLLVIIGHSNIPGVVRGAIFSLSYAFVLPFERIPNKMF